MNKNTKLMWRMGAIRLVKQLLIISIIFVGINEIAFKLQKHNIDRGPEEIKLVIPLGTAEKVKNGETVPGVPEELVFIVGDRLVVENQDIETHELGPILVPPGSRGSMLMEEEDNYYASCSFQPTKYLGLEIKEATTLETKLLAVFFSAPPTTLLVFLYSLVIKPIEVPEEEK
jgi:hypothetical protein